jgi:hypothetical protein
MKKQVSSTTILKQKTISITVLLIVSLFIMFLGLFFSAFSFLNNISFKVISANIHGSIFGLLVFYLGLKYYLAVSKLREEIFNSTTPFSWDGFKKNNMKK